MTPDMKRLCNEAWRATQAAFAEGKMPHEVNEAIVRPRRNDMRHPNGKILCDYCHADVSNAYLMCDHLTGEWCRECFADCPLPLTSHTCWGEGCPTLVAEAGIGAEASEAP